MVKENHKIDMARTRLLALLSRVMTAASLRLTAHHGYWPIVYDWWYDHRFSRSAGEAVS